MPPKLPQIEPIIPEGLVFIALTMTDPEAPVAIMGFPTRRRLGTDDTITIYPATSENIDREIAKSAFDSAVLSWRIIQYRDIPKDRTYRDALKDIGGILAHSIPKARKIALDHIRQDRTMPLEQLDREWMRAFGQKDNRKADEIEAKRQTLRDRPQTAAPLLEAAMTLEEIDRIVNG